MEACITDWKRAEECVSQIDKLHPSACNFSKIGLHHEWFLVNVTTKMAMKILCLRTRMWGKKIASRLPNLFLKQICYFKCLDLHTSNWEWFRILRKKILRKQMIVVVILQKRRCNNHICFHKMSRPGKGA